MTLRTKLLVGHVLEQLAALPDASVHCCVTSPPYWGLRDYGTEHQIWGGDSACEHVWIDRVVHQSSGQQDFSSTSLTGGTTKRGDPATKTTCSACSACSAWRGSLGLEPTPQLYVEHLVSIFREVRRVLRDDGTLWLNLGSSYASGGKHPNQSPPQPHVRPCDSGGTEPRYSSAPGSACPDLGDARQDGSPSHRGCTVDNALHLLPCAQQPLPTDRGSGHSGCAEDLAQIALLAARLSTNPALPENARDAFAQATRAWDDLLHASTSLADALEYVRKVACNYDNDPLASADHNQGKDALGLACRCGSCGMCFIRLATSALQFKPKDLIDIPTLVALALQADGWYLRSEIIWAKTAPMPESVTDRPTCAHEKIFLFSKNERYFYDQEAVKEKAVGGDARVGFNRDERLSLGGRGDPTPWVHSEDGKRNQRNVWTLNPNPFAGAHFATFPQEIPRRAILAGTSEKGVCPKCEAPYTRIIDKISKARQRGSVPSDFRAISGPQQSNVGTTTTLGWQPSCRCNAGDPIPATVLDPFFGSGTTGIVAQQLWRSCIGIDLSDKYAQIGKERMPDGLLYSLETPDAL